MLAPDWAQTMLCIIGVNRRKASPKFYSCVRTRRLSSRHSYGSFTKVVRARETSIFYFPSQKRRNYWWLEKTFRMLSAGPFRFAKHSLDRLEMAWWESVLRGSSARARKLSSRHFSRPDSLPLGLRGWQKSCILWVLRQLYILISEEHALKNVRSKCGDFKSV